MSVHRRTLPSGRSFWLVRWREGDRNRSRNFDRKRDAEAFDAEQRRRRRLGDLELLDAGRQTLADFAQEWWRLYAEPNLAAKTQAVYAGLWDGHVLRRLGGYELRRLTPQVIESFQAELRAGGVGEPTILKTLALLQGMLRRAVVWQRISANPVTAIKKPSQRRRRTAQALPPEKIEALTRRCCVYAHSRWGSELVDAISRSKIVLNIHPHDELMPLEQVRVAYALNQGAFVLSEESADEPFPFLPRAPFASASWGSAFRLTTPATRTAAILRHGCAHRPRAPRA